MLYSFQNARNQLMVLLSVPGMFIAELVSVY